MAFLSEYHDYKISQLSNYISVQPDINEILISSADSKSDEILWTISKVGQKNYYYIRNRKTKAYLTDSPSGKPTIISSIPMEWAFWEIQLIMENGDLRYRIKSSIGRWLKIFYSVSKDLVRILVLRTVICETPERLHNFILIPIKSAVNPTIADSEQLEILQEQDTIPIQCNVTMIESDWEEVDDLGALDWEEVSVVTDIDNNCGELIL